MQNLHLNVKYGFYFTFKNTFVIEYTINKSMPTKSDENESQAARDGMCVCLLNVYYIVFSHRWLHKYYVTNKVITSTTCLTCLPSSLIFKNII